MSAEYVDLHSHYLPGIDDGVSSLEDGVALCRGLAELGYGRVIATPHIRTAMFENRKPGLLEAMASFSRATEGLAGMPELGLGAEHYFDDVFWQLFEGGEAVPYPGGHALLVEFPERQVPIHVERLLFLMCVRGQRPVLAHPERYQPFFDSSAPLLPLKRAGALPMLDLMSLTGEYGRSPQRAAERLLEEDAYYAACSDCHRPRQLPAVEKAIERLKRLVGSERADALLREHPRRILDGRLPS